jgi:subtilase family serine protease
LIRVIRRGIAATLLTVAAATVGLSASAGASTGLLQLPALSQAGPLNLPSLVPSFTQTLPSLGPAPSSQPVFLLAELRLRNQTGLAALIRRVSDPASRSYQHYLTPAQFRARYSPSAASVRAVETYLRAAGFKVAGVPKNHDFVAVSGTVAKAESTFATTLRSFNLDGRVAHAPVNAPSIPAAIAPYVRRIAGLDTSAVSHPLASPPAAFVNAGPCSTYWGQQTATSAPDAYGGKQPYVPCGYTPQQLRGAYGTASALSAGITGKGQTVAIIDAYDSPTIQDDVNTYSQRHGLPPAKITRVASPIATNTPEVAGPIDPQGWAGEETLDVEAVHAMAPDASIVYAGADSPFNVSLTMTLNDVVDNKRAQIISNSYGSASDSDNSSDDDPAFAQAAATGIGIYFSAGDEGDETKDPNGPGDREVDAPANDPLVTAVGGTSLAVGKKDNYLFETGWGSSSSTLTSNAWSPAAPGDWIYGGGGGTSQTYAQPSYQAGIVPNDIASYFAGKPAEADAGDANGAIHVPGRAVPDVSMVGDPNTGFVEGLSEDFSSPATGLSPPDDVHYGEYRIGGTSLSSPLFAGLMALADQAAGKPHGFANPALYAASKQGAFRDVTSPGKPVAVVRNDFVNALDASGGITTTLRSMNQLNTLHVRPGYDDVTGLGSPHGLSFLRALAPKAKLPRN